MSKDPNDLSFVGHLEEMRSRLIRIVAYVTVASFGVYPFTDRVLDIVIKPVGKLVFTSLADAFIVRIVLTLFCATVVSLPLVLYEIWGFVAAALKEEEKKYVFLFAPFSIILLLLGCSFAYFVTVPIGINFLLGFSSETMVPMITVTNYISFLGTLILAFGVIFELPLVLMFLTKIGIATPEFLKQKRKYAVVGIFIVSALITPPDVITQLLMAVPLVLLYEIGIIFSSLVYRK